jgi:hypothetical protein
LVGLNIFSLFILYIQINVFIFIIFFFSKKGTKIILDDNQDHNDLEKCLQEVYKSYSILEAMV